MTWGLNKGFDFSDEGYNMLSFLQKQEDLVKNRPIYFILSKLTCLMNPGIIFWRVLRLLMIIVSSFIFGFGFIKWVKSVIKNILPLHFFYPVTGIATLMNYTIGYQVLSYNSLTLVCIQIISGLFLWFLSIDANICSFSFKKKLLMFVIGCILFILFLVKFPTSIIMLLTISFLTIIYCWGRTKTYFSNIVLLFAGVFFSSMLIAFIGIYPVELYKNIVNSINLIPDHDLGHLLSFYRDDISYNFSNQMFFRFPILIISPFILLLLLRNSYNNFFIIFISFTLIYIGSKIFHIDNQKSWITYFGNESELYRMMLLFFFILIIVISFDKHSRNIYLFSIKDLKSFIIGVILLICIPFIGSIGTNSLLSYHITMFVFPWIIMFLLMLLILFSKIPNTNILFKIFVVLFLTIVSMQIITGFVYSPYRLRPLTEQKFAVPDIPRKNAILFDYETSVFIKSIISNLKTNNMQIKNQPIISLYSYPGLVYLLGGYSPGAPWYIDIGYKNNEKINCLFIQSSHMKNLKNTIFIVDNNYPLQEEFLNCLTSKDIFFKQNYKIIDSIQRPHDKGKVYLYVPVK